MREMQTPAITLHDGVTLTADYTGNASVTQSSGSENELSLLIAYTMGTAETSNSIEFKLEFSDDDTTWYQESMSTLSGGTDTVVLLEHSFAAVSAAATYDYFYYEASINATFYRVSLKETGKASNFGTATVKAITSYV